MMHIEYIHIQKNEKIFEQRTKFLFVRCACAWMQTCHVKKMANTKNTVSMKKALHVNGNDAGYILRF
jgi:hypothetical protein